MEIYVNKPIQLGEDAEISTKNGYPVIKGVTCTQPNSIIVINN